MKNLAYYPDDSFTAFTLAVNAKVDLTAKTAIELEYATIKPKFTRYDDLFLRNELEELIADSVHKGIEDPLLNLYSSSSTVIKDIRIRIESLQHKSIRYTCQYCTIESSQTMDHVVPQNEFPEYSVHPKNLVPCCNTCNQFKGKYWRMGVTKNVINFYLDKLPEVRYLNVEVYLDDYNEINFKYRLKQPKGMSQDFFVLLLSHFKRLHLLERMKKNAISHLTEFQNSIRPHKLDGATRQSLTNKTLETCHDDRTILGVNHWKPAMHEALVNSDIFWDSL